VTEPPPADDPPSPDPDLAGILAEIECYAAEIRVQQATADYRMERARIFYDDGAIAAAFMMWLSACRIRLMAAHGARALDRARAAANKVQRHREASKSP
jgi:hypothetical protein